MAQTSLTVLGATGSIGRQTLAVVRQFPHDFKVFGLSAGENWQLLLRQIREFRPRFVALRSPEAADLLARRTKVPILVGGEGVLQLAQKKVDLVVSAITGVAGLAPTLAALRAGNDIALANKESLVLAGELTMRTARRHRVKIYPVDSEHSGVWQLLEGRDPQTIRRIILTASGGALRDLPLTKLKSVTPRQVLAHPTWQMGAKVTVDSATLANKAFEIIEAHHLFGVPYSKIEAVIHPQSLVHALVELTDGSLLAQLAEPDMRLPIQLALRANSKQPTASRIIKRLDLVGKKLEFQKIEAKRYPLFQMILAAAKQGGLAPAVAALAAEAAAKRFLDDQIPYSEMSRIVSRALRDVPRGSVSEENIARLQEKYLGDSLIRSK